MADCSSDATTQPDGVYSQAGAPNSKFDESRIIPHIDASNGDLAALSEAAWDALNQANTIDMRLFRMGNSPVRIELNDEEMSMAAPLTEDRMRHELARAAIWFKPGKNNIEIRCAPPVSVVKDALATPNMPLPILFRITRTPLIAPDGEVCSAPGYSPITKSFYEPTSGFELPPVSQTPEPGEISAARVILLDELLGDFPFDQPADQAHALAILLLAFARPMINGPTPLHLIEKPAPGTGASLLVDAITTVANGHAGHTMTEGRDEDEWRKRITAFLLSGRSVCVIDNLRRRLDNAALAAAITAPIWEDRLLGRSQMVHIKVTCSWIATGNNPMLSNELARRTIPIRLDARTDQPWRRTEFRHPDLVNWVKKERGQLVWSALTLCRAWVAAGRPNVRGLMTRPPRFEHL